MLTGASPPSAKLSRCLLPWQMFSSSEFFRKPGEWTEFRRTAVLHFWALQSFLQRVIRTVAKMMNKHSEIPVMVTILFAFWSSPGWTEGGVGGWTAVRKSTHICQSCTGSSISVFEDGYFTTKESKPLIQYRKLSAIKICSLEMTYYMMPSNWHKQQFTLNQGSHRPFKCNYYFFLLCHFHKVFLNICKKEEFCLPFFMKYIYIPCWKVT